MESVDRLNLKHLRYFVAVADNGSFRQAAFRLNVTQPTLSIQIDQLEKTLETRLFERTRRGTYLTIAGRELLVGARRVLEETRSFLSSARNVADGGAGTHRLGVPPTLGPYLLPHLLAPIHRQHQQLRLFVREEPPVDLELGLVRGQYDLILSPQPISSSELFVAPLFREPIRLVISREHPLANKRRINRMDLFGEPILSLGEHHLFHRQIQELCERLGAHIRRDYEGSSLDSIRQMVVMGMGSAFLPALYVKSEIRDEEELRITQVEGVSMTRNHALAWRHTAPDKVFYRQLAEEMQTLIEERLSDVVTPVRGMPG